MNPSIVIMGVAGCGKSSLGHTLAQAQGLPLIEGVDFHSPKSRSKMSQGSALTDADREGWLDTLGDQLRAHPQGLVMTCSALRKAYRDRLRSACTDLRFAFLEIGKEDSQNRVEARANAHFFSINLVASQFATLESPTGETGVLTLDAMAPLAQLKEQVVAWLKLKETT